MNGELTVSEMLGELEGKYAGLREQLASIDVVRLAQRPPNGKWSVVENLQHLVLTGLGHLAGYIHQRVDWDGLGLEVIPVPHKQARLRAGGAVDDLFVAWKAGHEPLAGRLIAHDSPELRHAVARHARHQQQHLDEIRRLLKRLG